MSECEEKLKTKQAGCPKDMICDICNVCTEGRKCQESVLSQEYVHRTWVAGLDSWMAAAWPWPEEIAVEICGGDTVVLVWYL